MEGLLSTGPTPSSFGELSSYQTFVKQLVKFIKKNIQMFQKHSGSVIVLLFSESYYVKCTCVLQGVILQRGEASTGIVYNQLGYLL